MIKQFNKDNVSVDYKKSYNESLFQVVAPVYDQVTHSLSLRRDKVWKKKLIALLPQKNYKKCLDLACGTGDIAFSLVQRYPQAEIIGVDLCTAMLALAEKKNKNQRVHFVRQDMCNLVFDDQSFDLITGSYALRNAPSLDSALDECYRVLKIGGTVAFLDFSKPDYKILQKIYYRILKIWCSLWGVLYHRNPSVYGYIAESLMQFPSRANLHKALKKRGFAIITTRRFFFGIMELVICQKER